MWPTVLVLLYSLLIVSASLLGGWLPMLVRLTHTRMQIVMSFVAGLMLGVGLFHMLPHAASELGSIDHAVVALMAGLLTMFFLVRMFHFHEHGPIELEPAEHALAHHEHAPACQHEHPHAHAHDAGQHPYSWLGVAVGLSLHTALDGMALGAAIVADARHQPSPLLLGLGTFLAILMHKPLDALSITSLMSERHWPPYVRQMVNAGFALMCPIGALLFWIGLSQLAIDQQPIIGAALAFSAGVFLCIALGDLLPELQFHAHDRIKLSAALLLGVALAYGIGFLEPSGQHALHNHLPPPQGP